MFVKALTILGLVAVLGLVPVALADNDTLQDRAPAVAAVLDSQVPAAEALRTSSAYTNQWWCQYYNVCGNVALTRWSTTCISVTGLNGGLGYRSGWTVTRTVCAGQSARSVGIYDVSSFRVGDNRILVGGPGGLGYNENTRVYVEDTDAPTFTAYRR